MRGGVRCLDDVFSRRQWLCLQGGYIVVIQTHAGMDTTIRICLSLRRVAGGMHRAAMIHLDDVRMPSCGRSGRGIC